VRDPVALKPVGVACSIALAVAAGSAHADQAADMQAKLDALQKQVEEPAIANEAI